MRTRTATETTVLTSAARRLAYKVEIKDAAGAWLDYTALLGADWVMSMGGSVTLDEPIPIFDLEIRRDHDGDSLSPFRSDSVLNTGGAAIDGRREVRISVAYAPWGSVPAAGDYRVVEHGIIDQPDFSGVNIRLHGRNLTGARLIDNQVRDETEYGTEAGERLDLVIQNIIDDWSLGITLDVPVLPAFLVTSYMQQPGSVWDAIRELAGLIGWDVRILWNDAASEFRPTLIEPDRTKTVPDYTLDPAYAYTLEQLSIDTQWIRNVIRVTFINEDGEPDSVTVSDSASIARFNGELFAEIIRGDGNPINTTAEATDLANAVLSDLAWPIADQVVPVPYFLFAELGDLFRFTANGIHYNGNLDLAVTGTRWQITGRLARTWLTTRGQPAGFYRSWVKHEERLNVGIELRSWDPVHNDATGDTVTYVGVLQATEAHVFEVLREQPVDLTVWDDIEHVNNLTDVLLPDADMKITDTYDTPPEGWLRYVLIRPYRIVGGVYQAGNPQKTIVFHKAAQAPVVEMDDFENGVTGYAYIKLHDRGIPVTGVTAQTQIGTDPPSLPVAPLRDVGDASVVKGRTLLAEEYEHEVALATLGRQAWIYFNVALATGETMVVAFPGFDQGRTPDFVTEPHFDGTLLDGLTGDQDTVAITVERLGSAWIHEIDFGASQPIDVALADPGGNAGQANNTVATYRITLYSDPIDDIDVDTLTAVREVQLTIGTSGEPVWEMGDNSLTAPAITDPPSDDTLDILLDADSAPGGYTVRVWARYQDGSAPWTDFADITALLSPVPGAPPTAATTYSYATERVRIAKDITQPIVTFEVRAEILNGSSAVVASKTLLPKQWYFDGAA